jgi:Spy/CpxP family protein refolding chaperone
MQAQTGVSDAQINSANANVAQREATLAQARIDLARTRITSPVTGIVIKRAIEKGQTVAASLQAPELFVIAQNLQDMQVDASIDESDVGRIKSGQKATFTVDAFPGQTFEGAVRQVRKAAQSVANVVTYVAVVGFSNVGDRLLPGMTANVRVITDVRENVLKVPNAALRVKLAGVEPAVAKPAAGTSSPVAPASATVGWLGGWSLVNDAIAQPALGPGGPGGGMAAQRERLGSELQLNTEQQAKLEAIGAELRPRFMALRELPEGERAAGREALMAGMRTRISAMLTPEQRKKYQAMLAQTPPGAPASVANLARPVAPGGLKSLNSSTPSNPVAGAAADTPAAGPGGAPSGNPQTEFRNRLVAELALTPAQVEKVDAIYLEARPKFATLRDLSAEERPKARERMTADIRARIGDLLTPAQKTKYAVLQAQSAGRQATRGRIYLLGADGKPVAYNVRLGITDGSSTELLIAPNAPEAALLKEGAVVVTGTLTPTSGSSTPSPSPAGPRMPF